MARRVKGSEGTAREIASNQQLTDQLGPINAKQTAAALVLLHATPFGGQPANRRFRMSHASLRALSMRPFLGSNFVEEVTLQLALAGYSLIQMEGYVVVQLQRLHEGLRRVPARLRAAAYDAALAGATHLTLPTDGLADARDDES